MTGSVSKANSEIKVQPTKKETAENHLRNSVVIGNRDS